MQEVSIEIIEICQLRVALMSQKEKVKVNQDIFTSLACVLSLFLPLRGLCIVISLCIYPAYWLFKAFHHKSSFLKLLCC